MPAASAHKTAAATSSRYREEGKAGALGRDVAAQRGGEEPLRQALHVGRAQAPVHRCLPSGTDVDDKLLASIRTAVKIIEGFADEANIVGCHPECKQSLGLAA